MQQKNAKDGTAAGARPWRALTHLQRLLQPSGESETARSLGEALVPFLLALAETCWFNGVLIGLAGVGFLHMGDALLPFFGPPLLLCTALWLFRRALYQEAYAPRDDSEQEKSSRMPAGFALMFGVLALMAVGLAWLRLYSAYFLLDPRWLLALANDLLALNDHFSQMLAIAIATAYFCWRASRLAQLTIEPGHVRRQLWIGLLVLVGAILLRAGRRQSSGNFDDIVLLLLVPVFLYFTLSAHALARTSFVRRSHPFGLDGNIAAQERSMLSIIGGVGVVLLVLALPGGLFFSTTLWSSLQPAAQVITTIYDWLVDRLSLALGWLLQPLFWLIFWLASFSHPRLRPPPATPRGVPTIPHFTASPPAAVFAAQVLLPVLILLLLVLLAWLVTRRRKRLRIVRNRASGDVHESVWSWALFWSQLKAFFLALLRRNKATGEETAPPGVDGLPTEPAARTVREIYRALLKKAAGSGYVRRRNETPHEFQRRLNQLRPARNEPQLSQLTEAYALTRYGGNAPDELELAGLRRSWDELAHKWEDPDADAN